MQRKLTAFDGRIGLSDVPGHGGKKSNPVLGGGDGVGGGRIDNEAAVLGGGGQIHIVDSDASSADYLEPAAG